MTASGRIFPVANHPASVSYPLESGHFTLVTLSDLLQTFDLEEVIEQTS